MPDMERFFNIAGPCVAAKHYMLLAAERLPEVGANPGFLLSCCDEKRRTNSRWTTLSERQRS